MIEIFVDDINIVVDETPLGAEFENNKLDTNPDKIHIDRAYPSDKRTMDVIRDIANSIDDMIKVSADFPSNHDDGKMPMLDIKVWKNPDDQINYIFYQKTMKNRTILATRGRYNSSPGVGFAIRLGTLHEQLKTSTSENLHIFKTDFG